MSKQLENLTNSLEGIISELADNPSLFLRNPQSDFSRNRKINFKTFVGITLNSGGCTMNKELLEFFDFDVNTPSVSQPIVNKEPKYYQKHLNTYFMLLQKKICQMLTVIMAIGW